LYDLIVELCGIDSISAVGDGENRVMEHLRRRLAGHPHFAANPGDLRLDPVPGDPLGRNVLTAFLPAGHPTTRTAILTGHVDVVDPACYGNLARLAFDPEALTARIGEGTLSPEARRDLDSGNFLFGRGIMDMKAGIALEVRALEGWADRRDDLGVNLLFCPVFDEENNSAGMLGAVPILARLARERELNYVACINAEPCDLGGKGRVLFLGSVGKIMPFFLVLGREAHVGEYDQGLNALSVLARIDRILEGNPEFRDRCGDETYPPMTCLASSDLRSSYSVTLPDRAYAFYNAITVTRTPGMILESMMAVAGQALEEALGAHGMDPKRLGAPRILSYAQCLEEARHREPDLDALSAAHCGELPGPWDERRRGIALAEFAARAAGLRGPAVVVGFLPPYYPQRGNLGRSATERRIRTIAEGLIEKASRDFGETLGTIEYFGGITDLSYTGFQGNPSELRALEENLPGWGRLYALPTEELLSLDVPVLNVGPAGQDAHKEGERLELDYSLRIAPELLDETIRRLGEPE
jgi:arginine utilization protein RocB